MNDLVGDIETFSRADLKKSGMAVYAEHESTDLNCFCWKIKPGPVSAWVPQGTLEWVERFLAYCVSEGYPWEGQIFIGNEVPGSLRQHIERGGNFHAWNAGFERLVLTGTAGKKYDFPKLEIPQCYCSMANARVHGLPGALDDAANAVQARARKRLVGQAAMRYLMKPRKNGSRPMLSEEPHRFCELVLYCRFDVESEDGVDALVPPMSAAERQNWQMDQEMNDRGWRVDLAICDDFNVLVDTYKKELEQMCRELTGIKPSRPGPLADWVRSHGYSGLENLQADTVRKALMLDLPAEVKKVLKIYSTFNAKAVTKFSAFSRSVCADDYIRHMFMFFGAGTGRWSAHHIQNLARPSIDDPEVAIEAAKSWDLNWIRALYPGVDPMKVFSTCVRGALIASEGKELVFPDFAGVEARYNAWMFNETWKLQAYRDYDRGVGANLYCVVYGQCFGVDPTSPEGVAGKQIGKVIDLSMGFEGGVGALIKMANTYRIDLRDMVEKVYPTLPRDILEEAIEAYAYAKEQGRLYELPEKIWVTCEALKRLWRRAHPRIASGWKDLRDAAIKATENPGVIYKIPNGRVMFKTDDRWLVMRLPSGRRMFYYKPHVKRARATPKNRNPQPVFYYMGVDTKTRRYGLTTMYGGSWCNNETQGGCRDLLVRAKQRMRARQLPLIGSVHDEPLLDIEPGRITDQEITEMMCEGQTWDEGLPLAVEIHRGPRYRK